MRKALIATLAVSFVAGCSSIPMTQAPDDNVDHRYITQSNGRPNSMAPTWFGKPAAKTRDFRRSNVSAMPSGNIAAARCGGYSFASAGSRAFHADHFLFARIGDRA